MAELEGNGPTETFSTNFFQKVYFWTYFRKFSYWINLKLYSNQKYKWEKNIDWLELLRTFDQKKIAFLLKILADVVKQKTTTGGGVYKV